MGKTYQTYLWVHITCYQVVCKVRRLVKTHAECSRLQVIRVLIPGTMTVTITGSHPYPRRCAQNASHRPCVPNPVE